MGQGNLRQLDLFGGKHRLPKFEKGQRVTIHNPEPEHADYYTEGGEITARRQLKLTQDIYQYEVTLDWGGEIVVLEHEIRKEQ